MANQQPDTLQEFDSVIASCRELFVKKLHDYGAAWRVMRPTTVTDQIYIKVARIRSLQTKEKALVDEGIASEFMGIVNYSIIALIQVLLGTSNQIDIVPEKAIELYDAQVIEALNLMKCKNHDYGEAWRGMRVSSIADLIYMKIFRTKQIENLQGKTLASEGITANYMDMLNYSVFALIKLTLETED